MKICFAFLTKGTINNESLWFDFFKTNKSNEIEILIHCTEQPNFEFLKHLNPKIFINQVHTSWGRLQKVQNFLLEKAKNLNCDKFIILSDSCIPIRDFNYLFNKLNNNKSFIDNCKAWDLSRFPNNNFQIKMMANQQWCIIDKRHYDLFLEDDIREYFEDFVILPEESYFSTVVEKNGLNNEDNIIFKKTTFVDWSRTNGSSPYYFDGSDQDIEHLNKCYENEYILFFRKLKNCDNSRFISIIKNNIFI